MSPVSPALASGFFTTRATWEAHTLDTSSLLLGLFGLTTLCVFLVLEANHPPQLGQQAISLPEFSDLSRCNIFMPLLLFWRRREASWWDGAESRPGVP